MQHVLFTSELVLEFRKRPWVSDCSDERLTQVKEELQKGDRGENKSWHLCISPQ